MRLFFAVMLPGEVLERVREAQEAVRAAMPSDGIRWTRTDQFHYTLKFLGEQNAVRAGRAVEMAHAARRGKEPFRLSLGGIGAFPSAQRPSTIWLGATEGAGEMEALSAGLDSLLAGVGFRAERRPFQAHLTLARIKTWQGERAAAHGLPTVTVAEAGSTVIDRFTLMQSTLKPAGSEYRVVDEFILEP